MMFARSLMLSAVALSVSVMSTLSTAAEPLKLDAEKSKITFVGSKADGKHEGGFKKFDVEAKADFEEPSRGSMKIEIKTESIWSDDEKLTQHLKNPDFFDVRKYPKIVFETTEVIVADDGTGKLKGKMEMLGKTEEVEVPVKYEMGEKTFKMIADFKLDRTKWGMTYGEGKINKEVEIKAELYFAL